VKFRRQQPLRNNIVDFVSFDKKLIIEIDGGQYNENRIASHDEERTAWLNSQGFHVLRFTLILTFSHQGRRDGKKRMFYD
jgi:very-short-patch-repair endonuclease